MSSILNVYRGDILPALPGSLADAFMQRYGAGETKWADGKEPDEGPALI